MKVKLRVKIDSSEEKKEFYTDGIFNEKQNILIYSDDRAINKFEFDKQILTRKSNNVEIKLFFSEQKESYYDIFLNEYNKNVKEIINVKELIKKENYFEVKYSTNLNNNITYIIEIIK